MAIIPIEEVPDRLLVAAEKLRGRRRRLQRLKQEFSDIDTQLGNVQSEFGDLIQTINNLPAGPYAASVQDLKDRLVSSYQDLKDDSAAAVTALTPITF